MRSPSGEIILVVKLCVSGIYVLHGEPLRGPNGLISIKLRMIFSLGNVVQQNMTHAPLGSLNSVGEATEINSVN
jgi:hypothetical protein